MYNGRHMLLSLYLSYRFSRSTRLRSNIPEIAVFILTGSLLSAVPFGIPLLIALAYPLPFLLLYPIFRYILGVFMFLSFPFYSWYYEVFDYDSEVWHTYRSLRFLTIDLTSTPNWDEFIMAFSLFLLINFFGAFLGYSIGKRREIKFSDRWKVPCGFAGVLCVGFSLALVSTLYERVGSALFGLGNILLETIFLSWLIDREFLSFLARARVATFMVLGGIILLLIGRQVNHVLLIVAAEMIALFGVIIYLVKLTVASGRVYSRRFRNNL